MGTPVLIASNRDQLIPIAQAAHTQAVPVGVAPRLQALLIP